MCISRLKSLSLILICYWHEFLDVVLLFKITRGLVRVKRSLIPSVRVNLVRTPDPPLTLGLFIMYLM